MKSKSLISIFIAVFLAINPSFSNTGKRAIIFNFYGSEISFILDSSCIVPLAKPIGQHSLQQFEQSMSTANFQSILAALLNYKTEYRPDDWFFYQLIRRTAQQLCPKELDYERYTAYKWFLLKTAGFDAILTYSGDKLLFYVQSDEQIYNIPTRVSKGKQYICLNYHDYGSIDFHNNSFTEVELARFGNHSKFSYKITRLPNFDPAAYTEKEIHFPFYNTNYQIKVKVNSQIKQLFANYPVLDYSFYFNIPLSSETYTSLIPQLQKNLAKMNVKDGVDFLMRFTRYAFLYEKDTDAFGKEKRMSAEETLLYDKSDCEDRVALFFYLVKEIYNLPMIVLANKEHVALAVRLPKAVGKGIIYNGDKYSICEPTPQKEDVRLGQFSPAVAKQSFEVAYAYSPVK